MFLNEEIKCNFNNKIENKFKNNIFDSEDKKIDYKILTKINMFSTKEVGAKKKQDSSGWYSFSKYSIDSLMINRTKILDLVRQGNYSTKQAKICVKMLKDIWKWYFSC